jgi:toxin FitB
MILLDTNVVSEPLRPAPDAHVIEWIDAQQL